MELPWGRFIGQEPEILEAPTEIDCGEVMPGFVLSMKREGLTLDYLRYVL
jgi:hypothetical protein